MANENISPAAMRQIIKEIKDLTTNPPEGIKMIPNEEDLSDFQATIDGPAGTPYEGGQFRIKLKLGNDFPSAPPKGYFLTKIFHPNVSAKGEICVNTLKKDWKPDLGLKHVLLTVKCLLIVPNPESALNEEAGKLLLERYEDYAKQARLYTSIHAKPAKTEPKAATKDTTATPANPESPTKKRAVAAAPAATATKTATAAKKSLKRL